MISIFYDLCVGVYISWSFAVCFVLFFKRERKKDRKLGGRGCEEGELRETHDQNILHEKNGFQFLKKIKEKKSFNKAQSDTGTASNTTQIFSFQ